MDTEASIILIIGLIMNCFLITVALEQSTCKLVDRKPEKTTKTIGHSDNNQAVVAASGYLQYDDGKSREFMPLQFKTYEFEQDDVPGEYFMMVLNADCVQVFIELVRSGQDWKADSAEVILTLPNKSFTVCKIENLGIVQKYGEHFGCDLEDKPFVCNSWDYVKKKFINVVGLVFTRLEFEVFGSPERTMADEFTTNVTTC